MAVVVLDVVDLNINAPFDCYDGQGFPVARRQCRKVSKAGFPSQALMRRFFWQMPFFDQSIGGAVLLLTFLVQDCLLAVQNRKAGQIKSGLLFETTVWN